MGFAGLEDAVVRCLLENGVSAFIGRLLKELLRAKVHPKNYLEKGGLKSFSALNSHAASTRHLYLF